MAKFGSIPQNANDTEFVVGNELSNYDVEISISDFPYYKSGSFFINVTSDPSSEIDPDEFHFLIGYKIGKYSQTIMDSIPYQD